MIQGSLLDMVLDPTVSGKDVGDRGPLPPGRSMVTLSVCVASALVWVGVSVQAQSGSGDASALAAWLVLGRRGSGVFALVLHPIFHADGLHLILTIATVAYAGRRLERDWGSARFALFLVFTTLGSGLTAVVPLWLGGGAAPDGGVLPAGVFGGAGIGLACLAALATTADVRPGGGGISPRHRVWVLLLVAATAMLLVPQTGRESLPRPATLWQLSAIFWAWIFLQTGPLAEDIRRHRRARRARREWERVRALHRRVNELLGKISREGIDSLTAEEHAFLREASRHYARRE